MSAAVKSGSFIFAISSNCARVTLPTFTLLGVPLPDFIPAAFLIESLNLKGFALNNARVSEKHSLVLENKSEKSEDILDLASHIQASVLENYNINLELEPQIF